MKSISVVIPVYKNKNIFLTNLKHNYPFIKKHQIIIINDDPETKLEKDLVRISPNIRLINNKKNLGFAKSANQGARKAKNQYLMFLNSDVVLENDNYHKALLLFNKTNQLFAVSFAQKERNNKIVGANRGNYKQGLFHHFGKPCKTKCFTLWPEGGACVIDKKKFWQLNGFDEDYSPFYWEDVDLGYRAWQTGYQVIFEPSIIVKHYHETTINKYYTKDYINTIAFRNQLLFVWKNSRGWNRFKHFCWLPVICIQSWSQPTLRQGLKLAISKYWFKHEN